MKMIGNVSDGHSYTGGTLIKVSGSAGSTVALIYQNWDKISFVLLQHLL